MSVFNELAARPGMTAQEKLVYMDCAIAAELPPVELPLQHFFTQGMYARQMFLPAGTVLTGKIHLHDHFFMVNQGDISIFSSDSGEATRVQAPFFCISPAGVKRAGFAHEDTIVTTVHLCPTEDIEEAERLLVVDTFEDYESWFLEQKNEHRKIEVTP
jgi:hypothetical protein